MDAVFYTRLYTVQEENIGNNSCKVCSLYISNNLETHFEIERKSFLNENTLIYSIIYES